ncbi:MAG: hypothetical protein AAB697_03200 [Patescibacteria group bacterium]
MTKEIPHPKPEPKPTPPSNSDKKRRPQKPGNGKNNLRKSRGGPHY